MNQNIVFLIPSTSRNCQYNNTNDSVLINIFYESIKKFDISPYKFVVGFDDDDEFYLKEVDNLKKIFPDNFYFHFYNNYNKSYSCIVNQLADTAINQYNAEFLYLTADDLYFYTLDYIGVFIDFIKNNKNLGLGQPVDKTNIGFKHSNPIDQQYGICTHPFIHVNHVKYLGYLIPPQIKNWFCDNWITFLYRKLGKICMTQNYVIENKIYLKRYDAVFVNYDDLSNFIDNSFNILVKYI